MSQIRTIIEGHLRENDLAKAIHTLYEHCERDAPQAIQDEALQLFRQFQNFEEDRSHGTLTREQEIVEENRLARGTLTLLNNLENPAKDSANTPPKAKPNPSPVTQNPSPKTRRHPSPVTQNPTPSSPPPPPPVPPTSSSSPSLPKWLLPTLGIVLVIVLGIALSIQTLKRAGPKPGIPQSLITDTEDTNQRTNTRERVPATVELVPYKLTLLEAGQDAKTAKLIGKIIFRSRRKGKTLATRVIFDHSARAAIELSEEEEYPLDASGDLLQLEVPFSEGNYSYRNYDFLVSADLEGIGQQEFSLSLERLKGKKRVSYPIVIGDEKGGKQVELSVLLRR